MRTMSITGPGGPGARVPVFCGDGAPVQPLPTAARMTDVASHTRVMARILAQAGVKFFHVGPNERCSQPEVPLPYCWEGPDGSRVLTMRSAAYGSERWSAWQLGRAFYSNPPVAVRAPVRSNP
jgi:hypothetical protein